jgi:hypothetical protein
MRYGVSLSKDYLPNECVVIRDFLSTPKGRVLAIIVRENRYEAEQAAQEIVDLLNNKYSQQS